MAEDDQVELLVHELGDGAGDRRQRGAVAVDQADPPSEQLDLQSPWQQAPELRLVDVAVDALHGRKATERLERLHGREIAGVKDQIGPFQVGDQHRRQLPSAPRHVGIGYDDDPGCHAQRSAGSRPRRRPVQLGEPAARPDCSRDPRRTTRLNGKLLLPRHLEAGPGRRDDDRVALLHDAHAHELGEPGGC